MSHYCISHASSELTLWACSAPTLPAQLLCAGQNQRIVSTRRERYEWTPAHGLWNPATPPQSEVRPGVGTGLGRACGGTIHCWGEPPATGAAAVQNPRLLPPPLRLAMQNSESSLGSYMPSPLGRSSGEMSSHATPARPRTVGQAALGRPGGAGGAGTAPQTPSDAGITGEGCAAAQAEMWHGIPLPQGEEGGAEGSGESGDGAGAGDLPEGALFERPESAARRALDPLLDWADEDEVLHETPNGLAGPLGPGPGPAAGLPGADGAAGKHGQAGGSAPYLGAAAGEGSGENAVPGAGGGAGFGGTAGGSFMQNMLAAAGSFFGPAGAQVAPGGQGQEPGASVGAAGASRGGQVRSRSRARPFFSH